MKNILYRKQPQKQLIRPKNIKNFRYSLDAPESSRPKGSCRQSHSRGRFDVRKKSRKENRCQIGKFKNIETTKTSMNVTKSNSPTKVQVQARSGQQNISNYKFYYQIGLGAFGKVWRVVDRYGERDYALKEISKSRICERSSAAVILNQRKILSKLDSPFLVNLQRAFQDSRKLYLLLDYLRGADLRYHICYRQRFSEPEIRFIAACLLLALEYTHSRKVIHKDIKPENVIFQENGYVRLTDFGIARTVNGNDQGHNQSSGTPVYMAPEILFRSSYSYESDFYSLGVVLFELMMGHRPYSGKSRSEIRDELVNKEICLAEFQKLHGYSMDLINLINRLLKKNPSERLGRGGVKQIKDHVFFQSVKWKKLQRKEVTPPFVPGVICQGSDYLKEIELFNEMNEEKKRSEETVDTDKGEVFASYQFQREGVRKKLRKRGRGSIGREC